MWQVAIIVMWERQNLQQDNATINEFYVEKTKSTKSLNVQEQLIINGLSLQLIHIYRNHEKSRYTQIPELIFSTSHIFKIFTITKGTALSKVHTL